MCRKRVLMLGLCCLSWPLWAAEAQPPATAEPLACGVVTKIDPSFYEPAKARKLTDTEQRDLRRLFSRLAGDWRGRMVEEVCMVSGPAKRRLSRSALTVRALGDALEMRGDDVREDVGIKKHYQRRFYITPDGLRVDSRSRAGEVELLQAGNNGLSFLRHYRTSRKPRQTQQGSAGIVYRRTDAGGVATSIAAGVTGQAAGSSTQQQASPTSVANEERYTLQLGHANTLTVTQHFIRQGVYTGSMSWRLRRD